MSGTWGFGKCFLIRGIVRDSTGSGSSAAPSVGCRGRTPSRPTPAIRGRRHGAFERPPSVTSVVRHGRRPRRAVARSGATVGRPGGREEGDSGDGAGERRRAAVEAGRARRRQSPGRRVPGRALPASGRLRVAHDRRRRCERTGPPAPAPAGSGRPTPRRGPSADHGRRRSPPRTRRPLDPPPERPAAVPSRLACPGVATQVIVARAEPVGGDGRAPACRVTPHPALASTVPAVRSRPPPVRRTPPLARRSHQPRAPVQLEPRRVPPAAPRGL
jgi:hypothetical protein